MREIISRVVSLLKPVTVLVVAAVIASPASARAETGEQIFQTRCKACHTIGEGKRVGPDLKGVGERRSEAWIIKFVQSSQSMVQAGDPEAVQVFGENNKITMPDSGGGSPLSAAEIKDILGYIKSGGGGSEPVVYPKATPEQIQLGQDLFLGKVRFANGGPSCNSCHDVNNDAVISGGVLALPLTTVFTKLGGGGVRAVLGSPPFPVMQKAFDGRPLKPDEVAALVGFLEKANEGKKDHMPRETGIKLLGGGVGGTLFLLGCYALTWRRRKKDAVNQVIFDRQIKSE